MEKFSNFKVTLNYLMDNFKCAIKAFREKIVRDCNQFLNVC